MSFAKESIRTHDDYGSVRFGSIRFDSAHFDAGVGVGVGDGSCNSGLVRLVCVSRRVSAMTMAAA